MRPRQLVQIVSGTAANKATEAAPAAYPGGIVDCVVQLSDGEYEVHCIGVNWSHLVARSRPVVQRFLPKYISSHRPGAVLDSAVVPPSIRSTVICPVNRW